MTYCMSLLYKSSLGDRIHHASDELVTGGDVTFAWVELVDIASLVFSDERDLIHFGDAQLDLRLMRGATIEDRLRKDDLVSNAVGCFLLLGGLDQFHKWCWLMPYCIEVPLSFDVKLMKLISVSLQGYTSVSLTNRSVAFKVAMNVTGQKDVRILLKKLLDSFLELLKLSDFLLILFGHT